MLDLARALFAVAALVASARTSPRHVVGVVIALLLVAVIAIDTSLPFVWPVTPVPAELALGSLFLGPTALPHAAPWSPLSATMDPLHHLVPASLSAFAARSAFSKSRGRRPETDAAHAYDRAGLRFVALAVLHALMSLSGVLVRVLFRD